MIKVLCETMTNMYDSSARIKVMEYDTLESFKAEVLKHYPNISISVPKGDEEFWFGIQYGSALDGFWFRWLYAIMDTERGCLYSRGDYNCTRCLGLPEGKQHCSNEINKLLQEIENEVRERKQNVLFVE